MSTNGHVLTYMAMDCPICQYCNVWPWIALYVNIAMCGHVCHYVDIYRNMWPPIAIYGNTWPYMAICGHILIYVSMYCNICQSMTRYCQILPHVYKCCNTWPYASTLFLHILRSMAIYGHIRPHMAKCANIWPHMDRYDKVWPHAALCGHLLQFGGGPHREFKGQVKDN